MVQNSKMKTIGKGLLSWAAVIVLVVSVIIFTIIRGTAFFSVNNLMNILRSMSVVTIFALAATVSMAPDGFDMSAGTLGTFSAYVFAALFLWFGAPLWLAIVLTIAFTMIMYLLTMFLILVCKIPDMLATCALQFVHAGLGLAFTGGSAVSAGLSAPKWLSAGYFWKEQNMAVIYMPWAATKQQQSFLVSMLKSIDLWQVCLLRYLLQLQVLLFVPVTQLPRSTAATVI